MGKLDVVMFVSVDGATVESIDGDGAAAGVTGILVREEMCSFLVFL